MWRNAISSKEFIPHNRDSEYVLLVGFPELTFKGPTSWCSVKGSLGLSLCRNLLVLGGMVEGSGFGWPSSLIQNQLAKIPKSSSCWRHLRNLGQQESRPMRRNFRNHNTVQSLQGKRCELGEFRWDKMVGASGFEPPTSWSRTRRSSQAEPRPDGAHSGT